MRGQGETVITPRETSGPTGAERAFGTTVDEAPLATEGLFTEVLRKGLEFWVALNQENSLDPGWGSWKGDSPLLGNPGRGGLRA